MKIASLFSFTLGVFLFSPLAFATLEGEALEAFLTITLHAKKNAVTTCADTAAKGPLTGLYTQETGNLLCVLDYEDIVLIPRTMGFYGNFEAEFERREPSMDEFGGMAFANGYSSGPIITPCHFNAFSKIKMLAKDRILWTKPAFRYDNTCCNLISVRLEQEILVKTK